MSGTGGWQRPEAPLTGNGSTKFECGLERCLRSHISGGNSRVLPPLGAGTSWAAAPLVIWHGRKAKMSQRMRKNGSPTPATGTLGVSGPGAGGGGAAAVGAGSRLQPMRATVPFQLKQQQQQQYANLARLNSGGSSIVAASAGAARVSSRCTSPTRSSSANGSAQPQSATSSSRGSPTVGTQTDTAPPARGSPTRGCSGARGSPPRVQQYHQHHLLLPHQPAVGNVSSPCSSPVPLWAVEGAAPPSSGTVRTWHQRRSPEHRSSPERKSPSSPVCRVEKPHQPLANPSNIIRRTSSLETLAAPYLSGHWPRDSHGQLAPCMRDKSTQTECAWAEEYSEKKKGSHKRSASWGSTDQLKEIAKLRQQLQRSKHISRHHRDKDRQSPFHGNHAAINQCQAPIPKSVLIPVTIPINKASGSRFRNSVEGLNQEIEIIIKETGEKDEQIIPQDIPDGHRAPPPLVQRSSSTRSIDTQTPGGADRDSNNSSRSQSISPASFLTISNEGSEESPCSADDHLADPRDKENENNSPLPKYATSPKPNNSYMFKREPPEGCEKVKVFEECSPKQLNEIPPFYGPDKNKVNFIPKSGSAFCLVSILKPLLPTQERTFKGTSHSLTVSSAMAPSLMQPITMSSLSASTEQDRISRGTSTIIPPSSLLHPAGQIEEAEG
ncbi:protein FAM117B [Microcaecilia unicolor]|uniref:Protein FAM117B n=1 Tax=Microcaecilia unicolor TaxID=1415580 RepID=A0A6P7YSV2_9AMPH|nr:protein FAM117B [Microcaecilia unicolor]